VDLIVGVVFCYGLFLAGRSAVQHLRDDYRKSQAKHVKQAGNSPGRKKAAMRQHRAAYWTREILQGLPVTRAGLHTGWMAHQTAAAQQRGQREEARTSHLEVQASIAAQLRDHKRRQEEAARLIEAASDTDTHQVPLAAVPDAGQVAANGAGTPTTEGNNTMAANAGTDGTYTDVKSGAREHESAAEAALADYQQQLAAALSRLVGMEAAGVDKASLADQSDLIERLRAAVNAIMAVGDQAPAVGEGLQRRHGGIKEAADDSPAPMAERVFYQE
jgi:hypothetical protein